MIENLNPYPEYKDSGLPWLGQVPAHWEIRRGKSLFSESNLPVRDGDEIVTCFRDGQVTLRKNRRTSGFMTALYEAGYQGVRTGQLVIHAMDAFAGAIGISDSDGKCTPEYIVLDPLSNSAHPSYFSQLLRHAARQQFILVQCPAVRERAPRFRYPNFGCMWMPLPPASEQAAIARFLVWATNRLDRAIRAKRRIIALLQEQKQAIIHRAVTRGLDPFVPLKDSGIPWLGDVPEHWELRRLKMLCSMKSGEGITSESFVPAGQYPVYGGNGIRGYTSSFTHDGNFALIGRQGALCGNVHLAAGRFWASEHALVTTLRAGNDLGWFIELIRSMNLNQYSAAAAQPGLAVEKILNLAVPMPPPLEQVHISTYASRSTIGLEKGIQHASAEITLLREYRTRLIADVVTGKLDVREAAGLPDEELQDQPDASAGYDADDSEEDAESDQIDTADD
jgi:type I restriction enzyme S subunit